MDEKGRTPLHISSKNLNLPIVKILIEAGADNKAKDYDGCPPLNIYSEPVRVICILKMK